MGTGASKGGSKRDRGGGRKAEAAVVEEWRGWRVGCGGDGVEEPGLERARCVSRNRETVLLVAEKIGGGMWDSGRRCCCNPRLDSIYSLPAPSNHWSFVSHSPDICRRGSEGKVHLYDVLRRVRQGSASHDAMAADRSSTSPDTPPLIRELFHSALRPTSTTTRHIAFENVHRLN